MTRPDGAVYSSSPELTCRKSTLWGSVLFEELLIRTAPEVLCLISPEGGRGDAYKPDARVTALLGTGVWLAGSAVLASKAEVEIFPPRGCREDGR